MRLLYGKACNMLASLDPIFPKWQATCDYNGGWKILNDDNEFLWPPLEEMDLDGISFHSQVSCHTSDLTIDLLKEKFSATLVSFDVRYLKRIKQFRPNFWPSRSCEVVSVYERTRQDLKINNRALHSSNCWEFIP